MPACPHCHHALLTDPATGLLPARCPHCGAILGTTASSGPSLASFLRAGSQPAQVDASNALRPRAPTTSTEHPAASPEPQALPNTPNGASVQHTSSTLHSGQLPANDPPLPSEAPPQASASIRGALHDGGASNEDVRVVSAPVHPEATAPVDIHPADAQEDDAAPSFTRAVPKPKGPRIPTWQWCVPALLVAALGLQMLIADRARLAQDAYWRPVLERTCRLLRCTLPAWHQPQAYTMLARDVQPVPGAHGVLQVHATFRNDAQWPQQWPAIAVSLSDADGRIAGARVLMPKDYLDAALRQTTVAPGQSGEMTVQVREPPGGVVAFAFEFR